eukprot:1191326-Prorocentrum_minimum.AAC.1
MRIYPRFLRLIGPCRALVCEQAPMYANVRRMRLRGVITMECFAGIAGRTDSGKVGQWDGGTGGVSRVLRDVRRSPEKERRLKFPPDGRGGWGSAWRRGRSSRGTLAGGRTRAG